MGMEEKLNYCGAKKTDFLPHGTFNALCDPIKTEDAIMSNKRDIDVVFIGALYPNKMPLLATVKKALGKRFQLFGITNIKKNIYFNLKYGFPGWVSPLLFNRYVPIYQRAKIGINIHNRGDFTVGSYRLFDLPANGVMQISDGGQFLNQFFSVGEEIVSYKNTGDLIDLIIYYLDHADERNKIARNGFRRVQKQYKIALQLIKAAQLIEIGMNEKALKR